MRACLCTDELNLLEQLLARTDQQRLADSIRVLASKASNSFPDKSNKCAHNVWLCTVGNIDEEEYQPQHSQCHHSLPRINSAATPIASGPPMRRTATASSSSFHCRSPTLSFLSTLRSTSCNKQGAHSTTNSRKLET